jgi:hypothetical protein
MERYQEKIIHYVYLRGRLVGRLVYNESQIAPIKRPYWESIKVNALYLGDSFTQEKEFQLRIEATQKEQERLE